MRWPAEAARAVAAGCAVGVVLAAGWSWSAPADVYWANETGNAIGRANLDGTGVDQSFITGATRPRAVALDGARLYWAQGDASGTIGRANLDGSDVDQAFVAVGAAPSGVAVDGGFVYWTHTVPGAAPAGARPRHEFPAPQAGGNVGRARLDGTAANGRFVYAGDAPCGVAVDADKVYWGNGGTSGAIGRSHGPFEPDRTFIRGARDPCGIAVTGTYLYWANRAGDAIGRARADGSDVDQTFIEAKGPCGVAADGAHLYWSTAAGTIGRARLDGTGVDQRFITGAEGPCGVAVDPMARAEPAAVTFTATARRRRSAVSAIVLVNTSSSVLDVSAVSVVGRNARDFEKTGDGCTVNVTPPGGACVVNARFAPSADGARRATLRFTSNASNSPTNVVLAGLADSTAPRFRSTAVRPTAGTKGATLRYSLTEDAVVTVTVEAVSSGRLVGRFTRASRAGVNRRRLSGSVRGRPLAAGRYRITLVATDAAGNSSRPSRLRFRVP